MLKGELLNVGEAKRAIGDVVDDYGTSACPNLDQYFLLAQESASKTAEMLKSCRLQHDQIIQKCVSNLDCINSADQQPDRGEFHWLSAVLETQNGRLATYCRQFHMCRPYWQEYATLWQTFTTEAVRQKHQIEMLQLNRLPSEQMSASSKRNEANMGTIRDHAVNLCSSALTLQRLGTKLVWKARHSELALGLNTVAYLDDVARPADGRGSQKSLRHQETLDNDVEFVCLTFDAVVSDLCNLAKSHKIESFLPPNLKIDVANLANEVNSEIGVGEFNELQETTFPHAKRESSVSAEVSVTDVEACMDRLREELDWLREHGLLIPLNNTQVHYATQRDSEFWSGTEFNERSPAPLAAPRLCSSWVRKKSLELSKLDAALKLHENRTVQLCHISEQLSSACEDPRVRDELRQAADELHISMETARGIVNRRRTRLSAWQSTCATFESALLMNAAGEEVEGEQTLPEMLCREFDPHGTGTGHTLETVEHTLDAQLVEEERQLVAVACQGEPQLNERVVQSIKTSLKEWHTVCNLLKLDRSPVNGEEAVGDDRTQLGMSSVEVSNPAQSETALNKLSFWLDTVRTFVESNKASLGGHFDQETVLARLKVKILL
ncbi:unnamed protein product [Schistocephalus solidus]|uniref:FATC domain-containing protein n=1 Tax=Schistocephalus solidus TaxID=70667 RepID=A0A183T7D6_SCHSO|nr:unnamed protein product [Schistocephalus solidus]